MRIAFDHHIFSQHSYSGISRYLYELASRLAVSHAQDVAVVAPLYVNGFLREGPKAMRKMGFYAPRFRGCGRLYRSINTVLSPPLMHRFDPEIVHETYYFPKRIAPRTAKVVLTVHDMIQERMAHLYPGDERSPAIKAESVRRADHVICISENTRRDLIELTGVEPEKTSVVHHGITLTCDAEPDSRPRVARRPYFLYVSYRGPHKNFNRFMQAYASSRFLSQGFDVVCFGGGGFGRRELDEMATLGVDLARIRHMSGDDRQLADCYREAVALIYPSLYEGFGIPPLEAMHFGCPVVCSNTSSLPEVVGEAALTFDPLSVDEIRSAMERVVSDEALRRRLIESGRSRAGMYSWQRCAKETLDVYRRAFGKA